MLIPAATPEIYNTALTKYFNRLNIWEYKFKKKQDYLDNAVYTPYLFTPRNLFYKVICQKAYIVFSKNIEYGLCHTLDNIIIIVGDIKSENLDSIIEHELVHIYLRYCESPNLLYLRNKLGLIKIKRNPIFNEITNPDTYDYEGLFIDNKIIFITLVHGGTHYVKKYYTYYISNKYLRKSTFAEIKYYNNVLPFNQNYHSEEIFAYLISN